MQININFGKTVNAAFISRAIQIAQQSGFTSRLTAFLLMSALLMPIIFLGEQVSAQTNLPMPQQTVPQAAPPQLFDFSSSNNISATALSSVTTLNAFLTNGYALVINSFTTPQMAEGFPMAKPVSPASSFLSSVGKPFVSFFALFASTSTVKKSANAVPGAPLGQPTGSAEFDFDNDNKADLARRRASNNSWDIKYSSNGTTNTITGSAGNIAPADYDGDGKTDFAVFNAGAWTIKRSSNGQTEAFSGLGQLGDRPVSGDYDGDGKADAAVYNPSTGVWYVRQSNNGNAVATTSFGASPDMAVPGNYDGDTRMDYAVFRPSTGAWHVLGSTAGYFSVQWGLGSDVPVPANYDEDGKTDFAVYRPSSATWYVYKSSTNNGEFISKVWGNYGDQPAPADYDGDNKADFAVWRPTTGVWHIVKSSNSAYDYQALGVLGDTAVSSAYIKPIGNGVTGYEMPRKRLSPQNATGGTNPYSGNFSWGTSLVGLPGRAGLDAGFGISYNSLIWTRLEGAVYFDVDSSNVSPGFRFGFPTIEPAFFDDFTSGFSYLMVTPSGARVRFDQTAVSDTYETVDSSYAQLKTIGAANPNDPVEDITITVTSTDGTVMSYEWKGGAFRCKEIIDRNGNKISINHDELGLLRSVTDTLGRVISVEYDNELFPTKIKQTWKNSNGQGTDVTHTWATFTYTGQYINTNFNSSIVYGPSNGTLLKVLQSVTYSDNSATYFDYNDYGQVWKVRNIAADTQAHTLNYVRTNLQSPSGTYTDCPRFIQTASWTENFNNNQETVVDYETLTGQSYNVGGNQGTGTLIKETMQNHPHGAVRKTYYGDSNWKLGVPVATEDWATENSVLVKKRWTWTNWTQDNENLNHIKNPRVKESKVGDNVSTRRTEIDYRLYPQTTIAEYGLVSEVRLYDDNSNILQKKTTTSYNLNPNYVSRRIIGLPGEVNTYGIDGGIMAHTSKTTFIYDGEDFIYEPNQNITPISHDTANFGTSFVIGRGNMTSTTRWSVDPSDPVQSVTSKVRYDIAGSPVASIDPLGRKITTSYADIFNDTTIPRNTFAYPTKITEVANPDTNNNFSLVKYRYDTGANVWAKSPPPAGNTSGKETEREYDDKGRLQKEKINNYGGAYTRYEYPFNGIQSKVFSTVIDTNGNGADTADEVMSESWTDGAGRVRYSRTEHPGSAGGWSGLKIEYDKLGRVTRSTVPTEINPVNANDPSTWIPTGDDNRGLDGNNQPVWLWNAQEYDWKSRVTREINPDGTDRLYSFEGCGCAGGQETTIQSELVPRDDQPTVNARRKQKTYQDILGRTWKTEVLNWDGTTPYTTTVQTFNGRDQVTKTRQYAGGTSSSTFQDVSMSYDGHGRMKNRHYPIEDALTNTTWIYNADDSVQQVIDPRGAITTFTYNPRGLVEQISYDAPANPPPNVTIPDTPNVNFTYDNLGNRISMQDGTGTTGYVYDELSRIKSETKDFTDLTNNLTISYDYHLGGGLKSITDPFNATINYTNDKTGRVTTVSGTPWTQNPTGEYAKNIKYRAFGAVKQMDYVLPGETPQVKLGYDNRLRVNHQEVTLASSSGGFLMKADFTYFADSRMQAKDDLLDNKWDRTMKYDFAGRLTSNQFGMGLGSDGYSQKRVYQQAIGYDAFSQMTTRSGVHWDNDIGYTESYTNGRINTNPDLDYDAAGNIVHVDGGANPHDFQNTIFDASGRRTGFYGSSKGRWGSILNMVTEHKGEYQFDGNGRPVIEKEGYRNYHINDAPPPAGWQPEARSFQVWSSVLGNSLTTVLPDGSKQETKVFAGEAVIAKQSGANEVGWTTADPVTGTTANLGYSAQLGNIGTTEETEPLGQKLRQHDPAAPPEPPTSDAGSIGLADDPQWQCEAGEAFWGGFSGMPFHCQKKMLMDLDRGLADLYGFSTKPENPKNISDSPLPDMFEPYSASDEVLVYAQTATSKQDDKNKKRKKRIKRNTKKPGKVLGVVQSERAKQNEIELNNAEFGGDSYKLYERFIVYSPGEEETAKKIQDIYQYAVNKEECTKAFEAAGAMSLFNQVYQSNTTIVTESVFNNGNFDYFWTGGSGIGQEMREALKSKPTTNDISRIGEYKDTGRRFIGITNTAISEDVDWLAVTVIHSFVHSGSVGGETVGYFGRTLSDMLLTGFNPPDLHYLGKKYDDIINHCTKTGSKQPKAEPYGK